MSRVPKFGDVSSPQPDIVGDISAPELAPATRLNSTGSASAEIELRTKTIGPSGVKAGRISALDFTKGALVLIMVLYHWLNYFIGLQSPIYPYLTFLPPSFICISGFLISQVYLSKKRINDPRLPRRLLVRGSKLLMIFILLNVGIGLLIPGAHRGRGVFENHTGSSLSSIFVTGNMAGGRLVAFYVLVPISYLLLLSAFFIIAYRYYKQIFNVMTLLGFLTILILYLNGAKSGNLELLTIGLLGISIGQISLNRINSVLKHPFAIVLAYLCYVAALNVWNSRYPVQVTGVLVTLCLIYLVGTVSGETGRIPKWLILLGKYSLLGYIAQIAILQLIHRSLQMDRGLVLKLTPWVLGACLLAAVVLTILTVEIVNRSRARSPVVDRMYTTVFS